MKTRFILATFAVLLALLLVCVMNAHGQQFAGQSGGTARVLPPYKFCLGDDNGKDACFIPSGSNMASFIESMNITGSLRCSGGSCGGVTLGAAAQVPVMNAGATAHAPQSKPVIDVRDKGVKGDGVTDDTAAWNAVIAAACPAFSNRPTMIIAPPNSLWLISSTISFRGCQGLIFDGQQSQGQSTQGGNASSFIWGGAAGGGPVVAINQTRDSVFKDFQIAMANGHGTNHANVGLDIDETGTISGITTNNSFENIVIYDEDQNASFVGIRIGNVAPSNVEEQVFERMMVSCAGPTATANNNGIAFLLGPSGTGSQPNYTFFHNSQVTNCSQAFHVRGNISVADLDGGLMGNNYNDLYMEGGRNVRFHNFESQVTTAPIYIAGNAGDLTLENNGFDGDGATGVDLTTASSGFRLYASHNIFSNTTTTPITPNTGGASVSLLQNNAYPTTCLDVTPSGASASSQFDTAAGAPCSNVTVMNPTLHSTLKTSTVVAGNSPFNDLCGSYQNSGTSRFASDCWTWQNVVANGLNPSTVLTLTHTGSSGAKNALFSPTFSVPGMNLVNRYSEILDSSTVTQQFNWNFDGEITEPSSGAYCFTSGASAKAGSDTCISRDSAGVMEVGSTAADTTGKLKAAAFISVGTKFTTNAGCSEVTTVGGATAGKITTVGSTGCTTIVTMGNSATAPNGWACYAHDLTTSADYNNPHVSSTATTATIVTGTIVSGDVIEFGCIGY